MSPVHTTLIVACVSSAHNRRAQNKAAKRGDLICGRRYLSDVGPEHLSPTLKTRLEHWALEICAAVKSSPADAPLAGQLQRASSLVSVEVPV